MNTIDRGRDLLVARLYEQLSWSAGRAARHPASGETRRADERAATALAALIAYVRHLPPDDDRLQALDELCCTDEEGRPLHEFSPGSLVAHALGSVGADDVPEEPDLLLNHLAALAAEDRQRLLAYRAEWSTPGAVPAHC